MSLPVDLDLVAAAHEKHNVSADEVAALYDTLPSVTPDFLLGNWKGSVIYTGHKDIEILLAMKWDGKMFHSVDSVEPVVVLSEENSRVPMRELGGARIREVKFRGVVTAAMVYDQQPVIDYFRRLNDRTVVGVMEHKLDNSDFGLSFILERI
ncbi:hypothetical protein BDV25DRAFT_135161 [Aspergillus avenaceus]|uniref:GXWXG protein-domain-containing protein n=1 Tax=Aspergillus avenaceus TaxID=36643 RepID=A0A5N6U934_ASPAV|nr:hypothetical protein BDV25DRAFT_135161 [Aspergillus avenaceus]